MTAHRKWSHHPELGEDPFHTRSDVRCMNTPGGRSREYIITNDSIRPIDDLTLGIDRVPPTVGDTLIAPFPLKVQPAKVTGERIGVEERDDRVLRVPLSAAVRGDVLQLENDRICVGEGSR